MLIVFRTGYTTGESMWDPDADGMHTARANNVQYALARNVYMGFLML